MNKIDPDKRKWLAKRWSAGWKFEEPDADRETIEKAIESYITTFESGHCVQSFKDQVNALLDSTIPCPWEEKA